MRRSMSAIGTKRTSLVALHMSAFGCKADIAVGDVLRLLIANEPGCDARHLQVFPFQVWVELDARRGHKHESPHSRGRR